MSQSRYIRRRAQSRRRVVPNLGAAPKQAAPFFTFESENSFFAPASPVAAVHRKSENYDQEEKQQAQAVQASQLAQETKEAEQPEQEKLQRQATESKEEEMVQRSAEATAGTSLRLVK
ncbi:hypothetical protein FVR03_05200 [Pontibacter qinzhouensis]|uniref:Uncharacterized protein n=1 Tax=Pontibacter qinzhouensis TaxID=2603253 RepID=A0A5C8KBT5_9BACT|nr:hypothetical protein [Pontibacter qinzhouensis]TXK50289.1 hypothetical protein FVR03_05200 [Pontibacter qinzhouensis]